MAGRTIIAIIALALILLHAAGAGSAESLFDEILWSADGGVSMPMGNSGDLAKLGFCAGFSGMYTIRSNILIGARLAYNRWGANDEVWEESGYSANVTGSYSNFEIVPQIRGLIRPDTTESINFFGQAGMGFYRMAHDVDVNFTSDLVDDLKSEDSEFKLGLCVGGGITLRRKSGMVLEIKPMYHIVFTKGDSFKYLALTAGIAF